MTLIFPEALSNAKTKEKQIIIYKNHMTWFSEVHGGRDLYDRLYNYKVGRDYCGRLVVWL